MYINIEFVCIIIHIISYYKYERHGYTASIIRYKCGSSMWFMKNKKVPSIEIGLFFAPVGDSSTIQFINVRIVNIH